MDRAKTKYLRSVVKTFQAGGFNPLDVRRESMRVGMAERAATWFAVRMSRLQESKNDARRTVQPGVCARS